MAENIIGKIVFARVGWMTFYEGVRDDDPRPLGGGSYTSNGVGHEAFNFQINGGRLYGYFQPAKGAKGLSLERIAGKGMSDADAVDGCTVIWISRGRLIGWWRNATIYRELERGSASVQKRRNNFGYRVSCAPRDAVLLPTQARVHKVPQNVAGAFGRANVRYVRDALCRPAMLPWMRKALEWTKAYTGPNLIDEREAETADAIADLAEAVLTKAAGGFNTDPVARKKIEQHAVFRAKTHFIKQGMTFVKELGKPYDLLFSKKGAPFFVEVKGTTTNGGKIILTPNEIAFAKNNKNQMALCVVSGIKLSGRGKSAVARGGKIKETRPWDPDTKKMKPISFWYEP
jgi:hypothetical protein